MNQLEQKSSIVPSTIYVSGSEKSGLSMKDILPTCVKNLMIALNCNPQWYSSRYPGSKGVVVHPIPWTTLSADVQVSQSPGTTQEWGKLPKRSSIGAIEYFDGHYRFGTPWSPGRQTFRHYLDEIQRLLGAVDVKTHKDSTGNGQWYRCKDDCGDRLWYQSNDQCAIIAEVIKYMVILQQF
jgi:hypothetical protein